MPRIGRMKEEIDVASFGTLGFIRDRGARDRGAAWDPGAARMERGGILSMRWSDFRRQDERCTAERYRWDAGG